ncbi:MAG: hypothetical protein CMM47_00585 [Rhodospirillaceae bacterium]|nr:hypothetical protein [Rhodospirillaceae bacterium]MBM84505.1 hypothetical protein [Rhodospirillaceae bacterium]
MSLAKRIAELKRKKALALQEAKAGASLLAPTPPATESKETTNAQPMANNSRDVEAITNTADSDNKPSSNTSVSTNLLNNGITKESTNETATKLNKSTASDAAQRLRARFSKIGSTTPAKTVPAQTQTTQDRPSTSVRRPVFTSPTRNGSDKSGPSTTTTAKVAPAPPPAPVDTTAKVAPQLNKDQVTFEHLNTEQKAAVQLAVAGESFVLIGAAGSGKTTTVKCILKALLDSGRLGKFESGEYTKKFVKEGKLRVAIVSFTNQAIRNITEALQEELKCNATTLHNLLEFVPVEAEIEDDTQVTGVRTSQIFAPTYGTAWREAGGQILPAFDLIVVEEAGSVLLDLYECLESALPMDSNTQWIFLGDLNQLPPPFNDGILGFKQLELPVIELTEVYRNVGIITQLAHRILTGKPIKDDEAQKLSRTEGEDSIKFTRYVKNWTPEVALKNTGLLLQKRIMDYRFDPEETQVLIPFNKAFGTIELNKYIMQGISDRDNLPVFEVITRFGKTYWSIGDRVLHNKLPYHITDIYKNDKYRGPKPLEASPYLTRWGQAKKGHREEVFGISDEQHEAEVDDMELEELMAQEYAATEDEETSNQASHTVVLTPVGDGMEVKLSTNAIGTLLPMYALTVHKSQGSEFPSVLLILHHSHSVAAQRETFYTGVTRARHHLEVMYSGNYTGKYIDNKYSMLHKCLVNQKIKGDTLAEKLNHFRKKALAYIKAAKDPDSNIHRRFVSLRDSGYLDAKKLQKELGGYNDY